MLPPAHTLHRVKRPVTPIWISVDDAAPYLGVQRDTIYRTAKAGTLGVRHHKIGRRLLLSYADVMDVAAIGRGKA